MKKSQIRLARACYLRCLLVASAAFCGVTGASAQTARAALVPAVDTSGPMLVPGDFIRIAVWGKPEFSGDFVVAPNGVITHPLLRAVEVAGIPMAEVEQRVRTFLARYVADPAFVLAPQLQVFVAGEVRSPGTYRTAPGTTFDQAMILAGGRTQAARTDRIALVRDRRQHVVDLSVDDGLQGLQLVRSGDQLFVARKRRVVSDVILPTLSVIGALSGVANLVVLLSR